MDPNSETTASATERTQNGKRTRFTDSTAPAGAVVPQPRSALESAKFATTVVTASLQPAIKSLSEHYSCKFLELKTALATLDITKSRFQSEDFIPTSARFKFKLKATDCVKENLKQEFDTLAERADTTLLVFQRNIKDYIEKTVDLEIKVTHTALVNTFCAAVGALGIAYVMETPALTEPYARTLILQTIETHHLSILRHSGMEINNFFPAFKSATEDPEEVHEPGSLLDGDVARIQPYVEPFKELLMALLARNWDVYLAVKDNQRRQLRIKKFVDLRITEAATADVAMDLEEPAKNEELIRDLISEQVSKSNRKLQNEISRLSAKLQQEISKNSTGGAQKSSASSTKQTDNGTKRTQRRPKKQAPKANAKKANAQQAAGPANDSEKSNRNNGSNQQSRKNNGNSTTNNRQRKRK
jgi:hypothetical protein